MSIAEYELPVHWLPALVNGDETGLSDEEAWAMYSFINHNLAHHERFECLGPKHEDDVYFMRFHDAHQYGVLSCNVTTVLFDVGEGL